VPVGADPRSGDEFRGFFVGHDGRIGDDIAADSAGFFATLEEPAALGADGAVWQGSGEVGWRRRGEYLFDNPAFASGAVGLPLLAAALGAWRRKAEALLWIDDSHLQRLRLVGVDFNTVINVGDGVVSQHDADKDCAVFASRARTQNWLLPFHDFPLSLLRFTRIVKCKSRRSPGPRCGDPETTALLEGFYRLDVTVNVVLAASASAATSAAGT